MMRGAGFTIGRAIGAAAILSMALSAAAVRAEGEMGPPCSATVKDHCMEGGAGSSGMAKMHRKHAVRHHKHQTAMASTKAAPAAAAKPAAKPKGK